MGGHMGQDGEWMGHHRETDGTRWGDTWETIGVGWDTIGGQMEHDRGTNGTP